MKLCLQRLKKVATSCRWDGRSAHYQVDVVYKPYDGIGYEATYVFDVEYSN